MSSKTPQFDAAIEKILGELTPHERVCRQCQKSFPVEPDDIDWYKLFRVPPPTLCPTCRMQRRMAWRATFLPVFYRRQCNAPGHSEQILSFYSPSNSLVVYDDSFYYGDGWEGGQFAQEHEPAKPFFEQFDTLAHRAPRQALGKDPKSVNCEYVVSGVQAKNCYYCSIPFLSEDIQYSYIPDRSKNSIDTNWLLNSDRCYQCTLVEESYNCNFCTDSQNCVDSWFLFDCKNCTNCFGCTNLRNKKYCWFNEQLTREEYMKRLAEINTGDHTILRQYQQQFEELRGKAIRKAIDALHTETSSGNVLRHTKNAKHCFQIMTGENLKYVEHVDHIDTIMDLFGSTGSSMAYEVSGLSHSQNVKFSVMLRTCNDAEYSTECNSCSYIFGCVGLKNKKFCIFNKQYQEDEYWRRVDELKTAMLARGEYGEFFPAADSPCSYKDSNAQTEFPLSKEEIVSRGWRIDEEPEAVVTPTGPDVLSGDEIPADIATVTDEILQQILICAKTGKPFRLTKFELDFYRQKKLPLPTVHPLERIKERFKLQRPYRLWDAACSKCSRAMKSGYDPAEQLTVYCEQCYQQAVL